MATVKKLLITALTIITMTNSHQLDGMEHQSDAEPPPVTLLQQYYHFSKMLVPDIAEQIISLQLQTHDVDIAKLISLLKKKHKRPFLLLSPLNALINSCGHDLATQTFEYALKHANISICDVKLKGNWTILHSASYYGYIDLVKLLLQAAHDKTWDLITTQDTTNKWTPSHYAAERGHTNISELLLRAAGNNAWKLIAKIKRGNRQQTILHVAVRNGCPDVTQQLIHAVGDKAWALITKLDRVNNTTALHIAAKMGHTDVVTLLLDTAGSNAEELIHRAVHKKTAFDVATPEVQEIMKGYLQSD